MGKKSKQHRAKVAKRNKRLKDQENRQKKSAMKLLRNLIKREKEMGLFDSPVQEFPSSATQSDSKDTGSYLNGPQI